MSVALLDEIVEKSAQLTDAERRELVKLLQKEERKEKLNGGKNLSPNIEWLKKHQHEYAGNYVALKDGELIAVGKTIKEADLQAKEKGFDKTLLHYIPAQNEEVWGGW